MATRQLPPSYNPYAGGAVVVDSTPYAQYYLRQQAEEKAKNEALDKYFMDLGNTISPTGMDLENDLPALEVMKENWMKHYQSQRDLIKTKKDGGKAYMDNMRMVGEMKNYIEQSKQKMGQLAQINDYRMKNPDAIIDDEALLEIDKARKPIKKVVVSGLGQKAIVDNHEWSSVDFGKFQPVKPLTQQELIATRKSYLQGQKPSITRELISVSQRDPLFDVVRAESTYDKSQLGAAAQRAMSDYDMSRRLRYTVKQSQPTPDELAQLESAYKYVYGPNAKINGPKDVYAAQVILENMGVSSEEKEVKNETRVNKAEEAKQMRMISFRDSLEAQREALKEAKQNGQGESWLEGQMQDIENNVEATVPTVNQNGQVLGTVKILKVGTPVKKLFSVGGDEPDVVVQTSNGDFQGRFYRRNDDGTVALDDKGRKIISTSTIPVTMTRQQLKASYGNILSSGKQLIEQLESGGTPYNPPAQPQPKPQSKPQATKTSGGSWKDRAKPVKQ